MIFTKRWRLERRPLTATNVPYYEHVMMGHVTSRQATWE